VKVLIPILSMKEGEFPFLEKATQGCKEAILVFAVDKGGMAGKFGFASADISRANKLMESIAKTLKDRKIVCDYVMEWGDTAQKIDHLAKLKKVDKIVVQQQFNEYWKQKIAELEKALEGKIRIEIV